MTIMEMEKISDFYLTDLADMLDKDCNLVIPEKGPFELNYLEASPEDFDAISQFGKIVKNYLRMKRLTNKN